MLPFITVKLLAVIWTKTFPLIACLCREGGEDGDSQGDGSSQPDTISIASRTSQNTVDSDKVGRTESVEWTERTWRQPMETPRLWRADDPQLPQPYGVSHAVTMGRSRGCEHVQRQTGFVCACVLVRMCAFCYVHSKMVKIPTLCGLGLCVCWCVCVCARSIHQCRHMNGAAVGDEKPLQVVCRGLL